MMSVEVSDIT